MPATGLSQFVRSIAVWPGLLVLLAFCLAACGAAPTPTPMPTLDPQARLGQQVFQQHCSTCHSTAPDVVVRGPSLFGVALRAGQRISGMDARNYIYNSILNPTAYTVDGFQNLMPTDLGKTLTGEELDAVVAYLFTLQP